MPLHAGHVARDLAGRRAAGRPRPEGLLTAKSEHRTTSRPRAPTLALEHALRDRDLLLARREVRGCREFAAAVCRPRLRQELEAADEAVARIRMPVAARFANR